MLGEGTGKGGGGVCPYSHEQIVLALGRRSFRRLPSAKKHVYFDKKAAKLWFASSLEWTFPLLHVSDCEPVSTSHTAN